MMTWYRGSNFGSIGMILAMLFQIVFWVIIIWTIITLFQNYGKKQKEDEALHILRKKYANGEISKKEFLEKKKDLI